MFTMTPTVKKILRVAIIVATILMIISIIFGIISVIVEGSSIVNAVIIPTAILLFTWVFSFRVLLKIFKEETPSEDN